MYLRFFSKIIFLQKAYPIYTAVKHVHIEEDKMCANGGILWEDLQREPDYQSGDGFIFIAKNPDGTRADTVNQGDIIHIFDADHPFESNHDKAYVKYLDVDEPNKRVRIDLEQENDCNTNYTLNYNYYSDHDGSDPNPHKDNCDIFSYL